VLRLVATILLAGVALCQARDLKTAEPLWDFQTETSKQLVMNGVVYFGSTDGNLYAID
jgi:outer membrane protein assembly factor BamB